MNFSLAKYFIIAKWIYLKYLFRLKYTFELFNNIKQVIYGAIAQSAEAMDLKSIKCGFESRSPYQILSV